MSIITNSTLPLAGSTLAGQTLVPGDDTSLYARYERHNVSIGLSYELGAEQPFLRLTPSIQIPKVARERVRELMYTHEDDRFGDLSVDADDGELVMRRTVRKHDSQAVERELADCLDFLDEVAYPAIISAIGQAYPHREADPERPSLLHRILGSEA